MKKTIVLLLILISTTAVIAGALFAYDRLNKDAMADISVTQPQTQAPGTYTGNAPDFSYYDYDGNAHTLAETQGKPTVINFWATWCPPCVEELPHFNKFSSEYGDRINFLIVNVEEYNSRNIKKAYKFVTDNNYTFPLYYDRNFEATSAYSIRSIPLTVFLDANGNIVEQHVGSMDEETLKAKIEQLV